MKQLTATPTRVCSNPNCIHKGKPLPLSPKHFAPHASYVGGLKTRCRDCERLARRERYKRKREEELSYNREYVDQNREARNQYQRDRYQRIMKVYRTAIGRQSA